MSEAWSEATAMIGANREVLLIVAGIFFLLPSLALSFAMGDMDRFMQISDTASMQQAMEEFYGSSWWLLLIGFFAQIVGYLALLALLRDASKPTVSEAIKIALGGLLPAIAVYIILAVATGVALGVLWGGAAVSGSPAIVAVVIALSGVGMIAVMVRSVLASAVIAIEKIRNPFKVLARSWNLSKGNGLRLFLFFLLIFIVYIVISIVAGVVLQALMLLVGDSMAVVLNGLISGLLGTVAAVVLVAVLAAIHRQLAGPSAASVSATFE